METCLPPPPIRTVLPALTHFKCRGISESLEDLVARIGAPLLGNAEITLFDQLVLDIPRLSQFIGRLNNLGTVNYANLKLKISCRALDWQLSSLAQACNWTLPPCTVECLDIRENPEFERYCEDKMEDRQ